MLTSPCSSPGPSARTLSAPPWMIGPTVNWKGLPNHNKSKTNRTIVNTVKPFLCPLLSLSISNCGHGDDGADDSDEKNDDDGDDNHTQDKRHDGDENVDDDDNGQNDYHIKNKNDYNDYKITKITMIT